MTVITKKLQSSNFKGSRKDLINVLLLLNKLIKVKKYSYVMEYFNTLIVKNKYIKYSKHLNGISHHYNGPSRRPIKTYRYILMTLKNFKSQFERYKAYHVQRIILNYSKKKPLGIIKKSRMRAYAKDPRQFYITIFVKAKIK